MIDLSIANKLIDDGFSLITVGEDKVPIENGLANKQKQYQNKNLSLIVSIQKLIVLEL